MNDLRFALSAFGAGFALATALAQARPVYLLYILGGLVAASYVLDAVVWWRRR